MPDYHSWFVFVEERQPHNQLKHYLPVVTTYAHDKYI